MSRRGYPDRALRLLALGLLVLFACVSVVSCRTAQAAEPRPATVRVAPASALYRHRVEQATARAWGIHGSPARLAAQLHQESGFRADARSPVGAQGIAQFMPATATWIATVFPKELAAFDPWNAQQAILAAALYDRWLLDRVAVYGSGRMSECSRWAFTFRAYNGGEKYLNRERSLANAAGADPNDWHEVAKFRSRADWAHRENIGYPRRILLVLEPAYIAAGWPGSSPCQ